VLDEFSRTGFSSLRAEWQQYHAQQNAQVALQMPDGSKICGIARGVTDRGELILETKVGVSAFNSGEVGMHG